MAIKTTLTYLGEIPTIYLGPNTPSFYRQLENACIKVIGGAYPPDFANQSLVLQGIDTYGACTWASRVACGGEQKRFAFFRWVDLEAVENAAEMAVRYQIAAELAAENPKVERKTELKRGQQAVKKTKVKKEESPDRQTRYDLRPRPKKF